MSALRSPGDIALGGRRARGVVTTELALLMPAIFGLLAVISIGAGVLQHNTAAQSAADAAARAAANALDISSAGTEALVAAQAQSDCDSVTVRVVSFPPLSSRTPGVVEVAVTCTKSIVGLAPKRTVTVRATSPIEFFRSAP